MSDGIAEYVQALLASDKLSAQLAWHTILPAVEPVFGQTARPWPKAMVDILEDLSIPALYSHQAKGIDALRAGQDVVVATPTASGKSLVYTLPTLERFLYDPEGKSLFLFPLKALAQDQLASFQAMSAFWPESGRPRAAVYDGDTSQHFRRKIRANPPEVLITNPEMLHLSILPHHHLWTSFFAGLSLVVVDEAHTYRGVLGSHMAQLFRRFLRIAALYGSFPRFVFCSATVGNPVELAEKLTGAKPTPILESGAPQGKRHYLFMNPLASTSGLAIKLLKAALSRNLRTIVYCQSRRMTELISLWASEQSGKYAGRISAYRAGFLPEERREIEARMNSGELLAVISTSALELGIDIGTLDLCILAGYPGTVMATLQRGGRVGRTQQESAVILLANEDALDQYIVRNAADFFSRPAEKAVLNPENPVILERHLECAAAELPLRPDRRPDVDWVSPVVLRSLDNLEKQGLLLRSGDGNEFLAARKRPQRHISLRGSGNTVSIETGRGQLIGNVDGIRACRETHPGAIYLHLGEHYEIVNLDLPAGRALARPFRPAWYTRARSRKSTEILQVAESTRVAGLPLQWGRLRITEQVTGYEKRALKNRQLLGVVPLEMPEQVFETEGLWFQVPRVIQQRAEAAMIHFMGALHALEHAGIGMLPLLVMSDRNDFGGIAAPVHPQTGRPTVFIYDAISGGAGLSQAAFGQAADFFFHVRQLIADCPCETGCPSCVHSPKCGSGNRPIDKQGALFLLEALLEDSEKSRAEAEAVLTSVACGSEQIARSNLPDLSAAHEPPINEQPMDIELQFTENEFVVLDVETRRSASEVGGWHRAEQMGVSVAVLFDSRTGLFSSYSQEQVPELATVLTAAPLVVGFNLLRFDYAVLAPHAPGFNFRSLSTLDMLAKIHEQLSYRVSLDNLAQATLNREKSGDGLQALRWWKEQRLAEIESYCRDDVAITRDLYLFGRQNGYLIFTNKAGKPVRVRACW